MILTDLGSGTRTRVDTQQPQDERDTEDLGQRLPDDPVTAVIAASAMLPNVASARMRPPTWASSARPR